jgi:regulator of sigma E protease
LPLFGASYEGRKRSHALMITILAFIVVLGITITVHEFGHFAMAKLLKIRVLIFSLGFGPKLVGFTRGGTEYRLSPFPLGGYVKMAGETFDEDRKGEPDEFLSHPKWHRFLVAVSGPFMNILLAVFILTLSYFQGVYVPRYPKEPSIVGPVAANSIAKRAGLETGDRIFSVNNNSVKTWEDLEIALETAPRNALNVKVSREGRTLQLHFDAPPDLDEQIDSAALGFKFPLPKTVVYSVDEDSPAQKGGLKAGDQILSVRGNGKAGTDYSQILNIISESKGIPLTFEIRRPIVEPQKDKIWESSESADARILYLTIAPTEEEGRVILGFMPDYPSDLQKFGIIGAFAQSVRRNYDLSSLVFRIIGRFLKGSASVRTLSGPIEIARLSGSAAETAIQTRSARFFFGFLGLISLQLGVFNLLPIPILDGGVIALLLVEGVLRRDLSLSLKEKIVQVGFVFLILLMGFVVFNDLSKIIDFDKLFR